MSDHKPVFLYEGVTDLDTYMSHGKLLKYQYSLHDIGEQLMHYDAGQLCKYIARILDDGEGYFLLSPDSARFSQEQYAQNIATLRGMQNVTFLQSNDVPGGAPIFVQICALIGGYEPSRFDILASGFITDYVNGAYDAGAVKEEVKWLALVDRRARGGNHKDEDAASRFLDEGDVKVIAAEQQTNTPVYEFRTTDPYSPIWWASVQRSLVDYAFIERRRGHNGTSALFERLGQDGGLMALTAYTDSARSVNAALRAAKHLGYNASQTGDRRAGLYVIKIAGGTEGAPIEDLGHCFWDPVGTSHDLDILDA